MAQAQGHPTAAQIQLAIKALKSQLDTDLMKVQAHHPPPTDHQLQQVKKAHDDLIVSLNEASAAVAGSSDPSDEWLGWIQGDQGLGNQLTSLDRQIHAILQDTPSELGVCKYEGGPPAGVCMTQDQCATLTNSTWTPGGC
jgi:hypothetical protein